MDDETGAVLPARELTPQERIDRQKRLDKVHREHLRAVATSKSLPELQSTIAGASGKTNLFARSAENQEAARLEKLRTAAESEMKEIAFQQAKQEKNRQLQEVMEKKKAKREKKLANRKRRREEQGSSNSDSDSSHSS